MKSMEGSTRIRPANGRSSRSAHGVGRERESETRERTREWARVGGEDVLVFNAAYGDGQRQARRSARGGDRRTSVSEWLKQGRRGPSAAPSGLSARQGVTLTWKVGKELCRVMAIHIPRKSRTSSITSYPRISLTAIRLVVAVCTRRLFIGHSRQLVRKELETCSV